MFNNSSFAQNSFLEEKNNKPAENEKVAALVNALDQISGAMKVSENTTVEDKTVETVSDDASVETEIMENIKRSEADVREVLKLFDIDYDALIKMDGKSAYSKAVKANPAILNEVLQSKNPVVTALKVATGFKPYAEFMEQYGSTPEEIKAALLKEFEESKKTKVKSESELENNVNPAFSGFSGSTVKTKEEGKKNIADFFIK